MNYIMTFLEGILTFISPCILPMLPLYFMYMAGSVGNSNTRKTNLIKNSFAFVLGFTIVFVALGTTVTALGHFLFINKDIMAKISGVIMIIFGLNFMGVLNIKLLNMEKRFDFNYNKPGFFTSILFGMVFSFSWSYCLVAFLGSALALAGSTSTMWEGISLLLVYSLGLGIPFILTAIIFENVKDAFKNLTKYGRQISVVSGIILILGGVLIISGILKYLSF